MLTTSTDIDAIAAALAKAQGQMDNAAKDRTNPAFKSKYADLASVRDAVGAALAAAGIAVLQAPATVGDVARAARLAAYRPRQAGDSRQAGRLLPGPPLTPVAVRIPGNPAGVRGADSVQGRLPGNSRIVFIRSHE